MKLLRNISENLLKGRAIVRIDLNSKDNWRLLSASKTLKLLSKKSRTVLILSHNGRPNLKDSADFKKLSLESRAKDI